MAGGSISHADPAADYLPVLAAARARVTLSSATGERELPAEEFFLDMMFTARRPDELVTALRVPKLAPGWASGYLRFARVEGSFAIVNAAAFVALDGTAGTLGLGGVASRRSYRTSTTSASKRVFQTSLSAVNVAGASVGCPRRPDGAPAGAGTA